MFIEVEEKKFLFWKPLLEFWNHQNILIVLYFPFFPVTLIIFFYDVNIEMFKKESTPI